MARLLLRRHPALRRGLLRGDVRARRAARRQGRGLRRPPDRGRDPGVPGNPVGAGPAVPLPGPRRGGEPRPLPPHAGRRVPGRDVRAAGPDRPHRGQHEVAGPAAVPDPPRRPPPDRRRLVHLPDVRLGPSARRRHRGRHPLHLHPGVREQPGPVRLGPRPHRRRRTPRLRAALPVRVRPAEPRLHRSEQAQAPDPGGGRPRLRLGRPPHADHRRAAPAGLPARGHPGLRRPHRRGQGQLGGRHRQARVLRPRRPQLGGAPGPRSAAPAAGHGHVVARRFRGTARARRTSRPTSASRGSGRCRSPGTSSSTATTSPSNRRRATSGWRRAARSGCATATASPATRSSPTTPARSSSCG